MTPNSTSAEIFVQCTYPQVSSSHVYSFRRYRVDKQTNRQTPLKTSNALRYATTLGKTLKAFYIYDMQRTKTRSLTYVRTVSTYSFNITPTSGPYVGFYFGGIWKFGAGRGEAQRAEARGLKGGERGWGSWGGATSPSPPARESGERCKLPQWVPGQSPGRPSGLLRFVDARWLFLAFPRLLAKHQRPHFMEYVILYSEKISCYNFGGGGLNP